MIYKARYVLTMVGEAVIPHGEVMVRGATIADVGTNLLERHPEEPVCDLGDCVLLPGFVNAHSHIEPTFRRNTMDALNLWDWLEALGFRKDSAPDAETLGLSATLGAAECALSGITCIGDSSFSGASVRALEQVGLRGIVYLEIFGQSAGDAYAEKFRQKLRLAAELRSAAPDRIAVGISPHSVYASDRETLGLCAAACREEGIPVALHIAETGAETDYTVRGTGPLAEMRRRMGYEPMVTGLTPVRYLADIGLLGPGICLAHCVHVDADDAAMIVASGSGLAHCPRSNAYLGNGIAPVSDLFRRGAAVGLGTDSAASCMRLDMFEEARFALGLQRAGLEDAAGMTAKSVLKLATIGGAQALGLADRVGTLEPGKRADVIAVDVSGMLPFEDVWLTALSSSPAEVVLTVVDGFEIVRDGRLTRLDVVECRARLKEGMDRLGSS